MADIEVEISEEMAAWCYATAAMATSRFPLAACGRNLRDNGWVANWGKVGCPDCLAARNSRVP